MSTKLEKIGAELKRAKEKAVEWSKRAEELEKQYNEQEKTDLSDICRIYKMTPEKLKKHWYSDDRMLRGRCSRNAQRTSANLPPYCG